MYEFTPLLDGGASGPVTLEARDLVPGAVVKNVVGPDLAVPLIDSPSEMI
ncbi:hypothetical protein [Streptomyces lydicamycinicus]